MITCLIQYEIDPHRISAFEDYASRWPPIIERFAGARLIGYFLPKEGATDYAQALVEFESLAQYEQYRAQLADDPDAQRNVADAAQAQCIRAERRTFLRRL